MHVLGPTGSSLLIVSIFFSQIIIYQLRLRLKGEGLEVFGERKGVEESCSKWQSEWSTAI